MMKKTYESPKAAIIIFAAQSFLETSGGVVGGSTGDIYVSDVFDSDYGKGF